MGRPARCQVFWPYYLPCDSYLLILCLVYKLSGDSKRQVLGHATNLLPALPMLQELGPCPRQFLRHATEPLPFSSQTRGHQELASFEREIRMHATNALGTARYKLAPDSPNASETGAIPMLVPNTPYKSGPGLVQGFRN